MVVRYHYLKSDQSFFFFLSVVESSSSAAVPEPEEEEDEGAAATCSLFIKNLSFNTTEDGLKTFVSRKVQGVRAVSIPKKRKAAGGADVKVGIT